MPGMRKIALVKYALIKSENEGQGVLQADPKRANLPQYSHSELACGQG